MIVTKIAIAVGLVVLGIACWMAVIGIGAAAEGLLTVFALVVLVAGGNLLAGRTTSNRTPLPVPGSPDLDAPDHGEHEEGQHEGQRDHRPDVEQDARPEHREP